MGHLCGVPEAEIGGSFKCAFSIAGNVVPYIAAAAAGSVE